MREGTTTDDRPEYYQLIGEVIRAAADLENSLWLFTANLLGIDQFRARIVSRFIGSSSSQQELIRTLANSYLSDDLLPEFNSIMKKIGGPVSIRNKLAHYPMYIDMDSSRSLIFQDVILAKKVNGIEFTSARCSLEDLTSAKESLNEIRQELILFIFKMEGNVDSVARVHRVP